MKQIDTQSLNDLWGGQFFYNIPHFCLPSRKRRFKNVCKKTSYSAANGRWSKVSYRRLENNELQFISSTAVMSLHQVKENDIEHLVWQPERKMHFGLYIKLRVKHHFIVAIRIIYRIDYY